ncbi:MAG: type IV secretory system conjugative DNA transfer family protein [Pseudomonadota bacterium]
MSQLPALRRNQINWEAVNAHQTQLGTAAWLLERNLRQFQVGDVWLGRTQSGDRVGIRDDRHVLVCSGSRAGKGTSFIIPNLCMWRGSAVIIDPKGENAIVTARRRANGSVWSHGMGQRVCILDPFNIVRTPDDDFADLKGSFNPLDALRPDDPESVETSFRIADGMFPGERSNDPFFDDSAKDFTSAVQLHVASSPAFAKHDRNLLTVRRLLTAGDETGAALAVAASPGKVQPSAYAHLFAAMKRNPAFGGVVARAGAYLADLEASSPRLFGSIAQVARTNTRFIEGESMRSVLEKSSFALSDLKTAAKGMTLYLCLPQRAMESHYRWLRMMTALTTTEMERISHRPVCGHPVLMMLDEFPALKRMRTIENAAAQIAGYGVKLVFIVQSLAQMKEEYKDNWETFIANSGVKVFACNDDHFTRDYVSKLIGEHEVVRRLETASETLGQSESRTIGRSSSISSGSSYSTGGGNGSFGWNSGRSSTSSFSRTEGTSASLTRGYSTSVHKRPLLTPDEIGREFGDRGNPKALVLISGQQPAALKRTFYFQEDWLGGCYGWHPDHAKPPTLTALAETREKARIAAELKETYARWHNEWKEQDALAVLERKRVQKLWRDEAQARLARMAPVFRAIRRRKIMRSWWTWLTIFDVAAGGIAFGMHLLK